MLFNLDDDPDELNDLALDARYKDKLDELLAKAYDGWDPEYVIERSKRNWDYFDMLRKWGQAVDPEAPFALEYPSDEYESDVKLL